MKYTWCILSLTILPLLANAQKPDFQLDEFFPKWGVKDVRDTNDIRATASVFCDGDFIHLDVSVTDDMLVNNADVLHTDHIEVWFGLSSKYMDWEDEVKEKLQLPKKHYYYRSDNEGEIVIFDRKEYGRYDCDSSYLLVICDEMEVANDFTGIAHLGLFLDERKAHAYDKENYRLFEQSTGYTIGDLGDGCEYEVFLLERGYRIKARFSPAALGFVDLYEMDKVRLMIDVVDVDAKGKQESLISSSAKRKWGNLATFNEIDFLTPLKTNLKTLPVNAVEHLTGTHTLLVSAEDDWKVYNQVTGTKRCDFIDKTGCIDYYSTMSYLPTNIHVEKIVLSNMNVNTVSYRLHWPHVGDPISSENTFVNFFDFTTYQLNGKKVSAKRIDLSEEAINEAWNTENLQKVFTFSDGKTIGIITENIDVARGFGPCGGCIPFDMYFHAYINGEFILSVILNDRTEWHENVFFLSENENVYDWHAYEMWLKDISWLELGKKLEIKAAKKPY